MKKRTYSINNQLLYGQSLPGSCDKRLVLECYIISHLSTVAYLSATMRQQRPVVIVGIHWSVYVTWKFWASSSGNEMTQKM